MSIENRRTKTVYAVIEEVVRRGRSTFRPGDVASVLRERGQPMGTWEIRGEFSLLEAEGLIELDAETGDWCLGAADAKKATA